MIPEDRWTAMVATGPASLVANGAFFAVEAAGLPGGYELFLLAGLLSLVSWPLVLAGIWVDMGRRGAGGRMLWIAGAVFFTPLAGTLYLLKREPGGSGKGPERAPV